jgi:hypothetical protein
MKLPIDTSAVGFTCAGVPEAMSDFNDRDKPAVDENGQRIYRVSLLAVGDGPGEVIAVKVAGEPKGLVPNAAVKVTGLSVQPYSNKNSGRSGVTYWAQSIEPASAARSERAAS